MFAIFNLKKLEELHQLYGHSLIVILNEDCNEFEVKLSLIPPYGKYYKETYICSCSLSRDYEKGAITLYSCQKELRDCSECFSKSGKCSIIPVYVYKL